MEKRTAKMLDEGVGLIMSHVCLLGYFAGLQKRSSDLEIWYHCREREPRCTIAPLLLESKRAPMDCLIIPAHVGLPLSSGSPRRKKHPSPREERGEGAPLQLQESLN